MAKELIELNWIEDLLPSGVLRKPMFGGFAYYLDDVLLLVMFESPGDRTYKNIECDFDIWYGCLFPAEKIHHSEIIKKFPFLFSHPVLAKWLYLPIQTENFEQLAESVVKELRKKSELFGVIPKSKVKKKKTLTTQEKLDTRKPSMFSDEPAQEKLKKAQKISDLKNLGPASETAFKKAGIKNVQQFIKLGWQKSFEKLVKSNPKNRHSIFAYALIGALQNIEWNQISETDKLAAKNLAKKLKK